MDYFNDEFSIMPCFRIECMSAAVALRDWCRILEEGGTDIDAARIGGHPLRTIDESILVHREAEFLGFHTSSSFINHIAL